jgi:hypothetical protein
MSLEKEKQVYENIETIRKMADIEGRLIRGLKVTEKEKREIQEYKKEKKIKEKMKIASDIKLMLKEEEEEEEDDLDRIAKELEEVMEEEDFSEEAKKIKMYTAIIPKAEVEEKEAKKIKRKPFTIQAKEKTEQELEEDFDRYLQESLQEEIKEGGQERIEKIEKIEKKDKEEYVYTSNEINNMYAFGVAVNDAFLMSVFCITNTNELAKLKDAGIVDTVKVYLKELVKEVIASEKVRFYLKKFLQGDSSAIVKKSIRDVLSSYKISSTNRGLLKELLSGQDMDETVSDYLDGKFSSVLNSEYRKINNYLKYKEEPFSSYIETKQQSLTVKRIPDDKRELLYRDRINVIFDMSEMRECDKLFYDKYVAMVDHLETQKFRKFRRYEILIYNYQDNYFDLLKQIEGTLPEEKIVITKKEEIEEKRVKPKKIKYDEELILIFTESGPKYVTKSMLEKKTMREEKRKDKEIIGKRLSDIDVTGAIEQRKMKDVISTQQANRKGYQYCIWLIDNIEKSDEENLKFISKIGLSPTLLKPFLSFNSVLKQSFASYIIEIYEAEQSKEYNTWNFYEELNKFVRDNKYRKTTENIKQSLIDYDRYSKTIDAMADLFGEDMDELIEQEAEDAIDAEDEMDDNLEKQEKEIREKEYGNIFELIKEFNSEYITDDETSELSMNDYIKQFLKWTYSEYPMSPSFPVQMVVNSITDVNGQKKIKRVKKKDGEIEIKIIGKRLITKLSEDENKIVKDARNFINSSKTYDTRSKIYILFHTEAYKKKTKEEILELYQEYSNRLITLMNETISDEFIKKYLDLWEKNKNKTDVEKFMNITPLVRSFLRQNIKLYKNPLIQDPSRRSARLKLLNNTTTITNKFLARLPTAISSSAKQCLVMHTLKPWWGLDFRNEGIVISHYKGISKDQMSEEYKALFGEFVTDVYIDEGTYKFYKPTKMYNLLLCHINYDKEDIVQCKPNYDGSLTLKAPSMEVTILTGIYSTTSKNMRDKFRLVSKEMYDKECEWLKNISMSNVSIINKIKRTMLNGDTRDSEYFLRFLKSNISSVLNSFYEKVYNIVSERPEYFEEKIKKVSSYVMNYFMENRNVNIYQVLTKYVECISPLMELLYPTKSFMKFYKSLWTDITKMNQKYINEILEMPIDYKYMEIYSYPDFYKKQRMIQIIENYFSEMTDDLVVSFHNTYYTNRSPIKYINGRKIGYFDEFKVKSQLELFDDKLNPDAICLNNSKNIPENRIIFVKCIIKNENNEDEEKVICMDIMKLHSLYDKDNKEDYYTLTEKIGSKNVDIYVPSSVVNMIYQLVESSSDNVKYSFNFHVDDIELSCSLCENEIHSDDFYFKTFEQYDEGSSSVSTKLVVYCSTDCFNKQVEEPVTHIKPLHFDLSDDSELKRRIYRNFMFKILKENKQQLMSKNVSVYNLEKKINDYLISPEEFKMEVGPEILNKYSNMMYYLQF